MRVRDQLGQHGETAISCLRTAAMLIKQAIPDDHGLRFTESAAYNLREALEAVVNGRAPSSDKEPDVIAAWETYKLEIEQPTADRAAALAQFESVLQQVTDRSSRRSYMRPAY